MVELSTNRKNKVNLQDYNYQKDIECRMQIADFSFFEHEVLQEIFFSPLRLSKRKLAQNLECDQEALTEFLETLNHMDLLSLKGDEVLVDKEMRKHFEFYAMRFDADFHADMDYLQGILRKVPIHILPNWYSIPRTSNNIFESIIEKYLLTPQIFQRYLSELSFSNPIASKIVEDLFESPNYRISSSDIITKYNLKREAFEELLLHLEFSFVCCLTYTPGDGMWHEWITPFYEWHEYLTFLKTTECCPIQDIKRIKRPSTKEFSFAIELAQVLAQIQEGTQPSPSKALEKALELSFVEEKQGRLHLCKRGEEFIEMNHPDRALYLYRHPPAQVLGTAMTEKKLRETEKSIKRVLSSGWVFFDEFIKGSTVAIQDQPSLILQRAGKSWRYALPSYSTEDQEILKWTVLEWLFEAGITSIGTYEGRNCFMVTEFGKFFFED